MLLGSACSLLLLPCSLFAQGTLTPPGAPAPTMKTLDQIEPRIAINTINTPGDGTTLFKIIQPGSYYLTSNVNGIAGKAGITILASGVTLDLMGFEIAGMVGNAFTGVVAGPNRNNIVIRNGTVRDWGADGVNTTSAANSQFRDLRLSGNGTTGLNVGENSTVNNCSAHQNLGNGIATSDNSNIANCVALANGGIGIAAGLGNTISGCSAQLNTLDGIVANSASTVTGCTAYGNFSNGIRTGDGCTINGCTTRSNSGNGIMTAFDCTVAHCTVRRNDLNGIVANTGNTISDCTVNFNGTHGITLTSDSHVFRNTCRQNGRIGQGTGILAVNGQNRIDDNQTSNNTGFGIWCQVAGNIVVRNTAGSAAGVSNWNVQGLNSFGPVSNLSNTVTTTSPWANFNSDR